MSSRFVSVLLVCGLATCFLAGVAATTPDGSASPQVSPVVADTDPPVAPALQQAPGGDTTVTRFRVFQNGSADWSVTIRFDLGSNESAREFEAFREEFETSRSQFLAFRNRTTGVVDAADGAIDREMRATDFGREIGVENITGPRGYVTYRLRWHGFGSVQNGTVTVGDVFQGGTFLGANQIMIMEAPEGYEPTNISPTADEAGERKVQWNGPDSFANERPRVEFVAPDTRSTNSTDGGSSDGGFGTTALFAGATGILLFSGVGVFYLRRRNQPGTTERETATNGSGSDETGSDSPGFGELATEEDKVIALLESEGGRIRQSEVADRLGWSASKTSRVLSDMTDSGAVEKLRIGRENVIDLVEEDGDDT